MEPVEPAALTPLQAARLDKGWKAARLAAELGVSETTLSRWEHGRQQPTLGHQQRLCEVLDMDPVELGFQGAILEVGTRREFMGQVTAWSAPPQWKPSSTSAVRTRSIGTR
jgi:transcriptional regulator with XRE-family HTH domain